MANRAAYEGIRWWAALGLVGSRYRVIIGNGLARDRRLQRTRHLSITFSPLPSSCSVLYLTLITTFLPGHSHRPLALPGAADSPDYRCPVTLSQKMVSIFEWGNLCIKSTLVYVGPEYMRES